MAADYQRYSIDFGNIDDFQRPKELVEEDIVPLEESLYLNKAKEARQQLMGLANDDPSHFMDLLYLARLNEDSEIVTMRQPLFLKFQVNTMRS